MYSVGIHALCVEQPRYELRALLQPEEMELLMLDIFDMKSYWEMYWEDEIVGWRLRLTFDNFTLNLNSWSF